MSGRFSGFDVLLSMLRDAGGIAWNGSWGCAVLVAGQMLING